MTNSDIIDKCRDIIEQWDNHGKYNQTKADKESFGEPIEFILAKRLLELEEKIEWLEESSKWRGSDEDR